MPVSIKTPLPPHLRLIDLMVGGLGRVITRDSVFYNHIIYRTGQDTFVDLSNPSYVWSTSSEMRQSEMIPLPPGTQLTVD
jgi:hypothetical protein